MLSKLLTPPSKAPLIPASANFDSLSVGTLQVEQHIVGDIELIGDVTGSGAGIVFTTLADHVVTLEKLAPYEPLSIVCSDEFGVPHYVSGVGHNVGDALTVGNNGELTFAPLQSSDQLPHGHILIGNSDNKAVPQLPHGDVTISDEGVTTISDHVITNDKLSQHNVTCVLGAPNGTDIEYIEPMTDIEQYIVGNSNTVEWGSIGPEHIPLQFKHILIGDDSDQAISREVLGDLEMTNDYELIIKDHVVTFDKIQTIDQLSIVGQTLITANNDHTVLKHVNDSIVFDRITNADIIDNADIPLSKLEQIVQSSVIGSNEIGTIIPIQATIPNTFLQYTEHGLEFGLIGTGEVGTDVDISTDDSTNDQLPILFTNNSSALASSDLTYNPSTNDIYVSKILTNKIDDVNGYLDFLNTGTTLNSVGPIHLLPGPNSDIVLGDENDVSIEFVNSNTTIIRSSNTKDFTIKVQEPPFVVDLDQQIGKLNIHSNNFWIQPGLSFFTGHNGGHLSIIGGLGGENSQNPSGPDGQGGSIEILSESGKNGDEDSPTGQDGGKIDVKTGTGGYSEESYSGRGGNINIQAGNCGHEWGGASRGGNITIHSGNASYIGPSHGGDIIITGGSGVTNSGHIMFTPGLKNSGAVGHIHVSPGSNMNGDKNYCTMGGSITNNGNPRFFAYIDQEVMSYQVGTVVNFPSTKYNILSCYNNGVFTTPYKGLYIFQGTMLTNTGSPCVTLIVNNNGPNNDEYSEYRLVSAVDYDSLLQYCTSVILYPNSFVNLVIKFTADNTFNISGKYANSYISTFSGFCVTALE